MGGPKVPWHGSDALIAVHFRDKRTRPAIVWPGGRQPVSVNATYIDASLAKQLDFGAASAYASRRSPATPPATCS